MAKEHEKQPIQTALTEREYWTERLQKTTDKLPVLDLTHDDEALAAWFDEE